MSAQPENFRPDDLADSTLAIEFLTENGFSIVRPWEVAGVPPPTTGNYLFLVRNPQNLEREIAVLVSPDLVVQIELLTGQRITIRSSFWVCCAERHLADHLWEHEDHPAGGQLLVDRLDPRDLDSAIRWKAI